MKKMFVLLTVVALCFAGCKSAVEDVAQVNVTQPEKYTITFHAGGGTGTMEPQEFTPGEEVKLKKCEFTSPYYEIAESNERKYCAYFGRDFEAPPHSVGFDGWIYTTEDGKQFILNDEDVAIFLNENIDLYPIWKQIMRYFYTSA